MKMREVREAEEIGVVPGREPGFVTRRTFTLHLDCGHTAMVCTVVAPRWCDCMLCADSAVQLMLPMFLPTAREAWR